MAAYLLTYRLGHTGDFDRAEEFAYRLRRGDWWGETGTTMIVNTDEAIDDFCWRVLSPPYFDERVDICVVFNLDTGEGRAKGRFQDPNLFIAAPNVLNITGED